MSKSKKPAPKKVAAKKPAAKKAPPKKATKPAPKPVKNKAKPAAKKAAKKAKPAKTPEQKLLELSPNATALEARIAADKSPKQEETKMQNIPAPPNVLNPASNAVAVIAFPPEGWTLHPDSAKFGQNFYYMGQECISETDLRARCAPTIAPTAVTLPPAPPMPTAAPAAAVEAPKRKRRTKAEIAADEAAKAAGNAATPTGAPQPGITAPAIAAPAALPVSAPSAVQAAPVPVAAPAPAFAPPQWQQPPVAAPVLPAPVAAPTAYNPVNEANLQELGKWYSLTVQMEGTKLLRQEERTLRADLFNRFFPNADENTNNLALPGGWGNLKANVPVDRKVIPEKMAEAFAELATVGYSPEQIAAAGNTLIGWEPKLNLEAYRLLPANVQAVINKCLDIKLGSVSLELQLPTPQQ